MELSTHRGKEGFPYASEIQHSEYSHFWFFMPTNASYRQTLLHMHVDWFLVGFPHLAASANHNERIRNRALGDLQLACLGTMRRAKVRTPLARSRLELEGAQLPIARGSAVLIHVLRFVRYFAR